MKDLALGAIAIVFTIVCVALAAYVQSTKIAPELSVKEFAADPDSRLDQKVRVKTDGMEQDGPRQLIYRTHAGTPPIVIVRFRSPVPNPIPPFITGYCRGRQAGAAILECP